MIYRDNKEANGRLEINQMWMPFSREQNQISFGTEYLSGSVYIHLVVFTNDQNRNRTFGCNLHQIALLYW